MGARLAEIVRRMMDAGWKPGGSVRELRIGTIEAELGIEFPADYRAFLKETGAARWRGLWGVDEIVSLNRAMPIFQAFRGIVGIGSEGFFVVAFDFRGPGLPPVVSLGLSSSDPEDIQKEADSFLEWLESTLPKR